MNIAILIVVLFVIIIIMGIVVYLIYKESPPPGEKIISPRVYKQLLNTDYPYQGDISLPKN